MIFSLGDWESEFGPAPSFPYGLCSSASGRTERFRPHRPPPQARDMRRRSISLQGPGEKYPRKNLT